VSTRRRYGILPRLGLQPSVTQVVRERMDEVVARIEGLNGSVTGPVVDALDAGCGRKSVLVAYRPRLRRIVGVDLHEPPPGSMPHLDAFATADLCGPAEAFSGDTFDVVLSSFTVEHFSDPPAAFRNLRRWIRPGGSLVITTVNRRHPLVRLYLALPDPIQRPLQRMVKASAADAHPLVGICNDPGAIRRALQDAGFVDIRLATVPHLARSWGRRWPSFALGLLGDLLAQPVPSRRSTIVADARVPH
jgi:SAM-dependent methyltransferase